MADTSPGPAPGRPSHICALTDSEEYEDALLPPFQETE
ncbi:MAG: hypothetical protein JWQ76_2092 [Ramlibacter sp.]|nr:hypothetical protein [Ramlibacter sp.]